MLSAEGPFLWERLREARKPVVLYGMGNGADRILAACAQHGVPVQGVFASDGFVRGHSYAGHEVLSYAEMSRRLKDFVVLVAFGTHRPEVMANILRIAAERELYLPDMELATGKPFTREVLERDLAGLEATYARLADERSRETLLAVLSYRITGDIRHLARVFPEEGDAGWSLARPGPAEVVVDGGAYDGDTVLEYLAVAGGARRLLAFEPDPRSFRKLERALADIPGAQAVQAALGQHAGLVGFAAAAGRQSRAGSGRLVRQARLDDMAPDATCVKLDVEGREMSALQGARRTIREKRPRLLVSAYHRHADLWTIPRYVLGLRPDYEVLLRASAAFPAWDMRLCFA